jgi:hypothetical protein
MARSGAGTLGVLHPSARSLSGTPAPATSSKTNLSHSTGHAPSRQPSSKRERSWRCHKWSTVRFSREAIKRAAEPRCRARRCERGAVGSLATRPGMRGRPMIHRHEHIFHHSRPWDHKATLIFHGHGHGVMILEWPCMR